MQPENSGTNFTDDDKLKALAIVHIFETSRAFGDYAACVVLNDGAGVSYGINQFTHRSGSLLAVVEAYLANGGKVGAEVLDENLPQLRRTTPAAVNRLSENEQFKKALRAAAVTSEMKAAQTHIAFERYLRPAMEICRTRGFVLPLSLAVVYDSITHGSWERIAARVTPVHLTTEKAWITEYIRKRHFWLANVPRLKTTSYRTKFFLGQIAVSNWTLRLPLIVHGVRLTEAMFPVAVGKPIPEAAATGDESAGAAETKNGETPDVTNAETPVFETVGNALNSAGEKFDSVDNAVSAVTSRADSAKSLWTTVIGTISQAAWAVFGFLAGLPVEVWIVVAVIAAALMLLYLYRQIVMGKIREKRIADNGGL